MPNPVLKANTPSPGYIAWDAFTLAYDGKQHPISAGSTNKRYTYWLYNNNNGGPLQFTDDLEAIEDELGNDDTLLFLNRGGIPISALNASIVDGSIIATESIIGESISGNTITGDKLLANTISTRELEANVITADYLAADAVTARHIEAGAVRAEHIRAGAVTASAMAVTDLTNQLENPYFSTRTLDGWSGTGSWTVSVSSQTSIDNFIQRDTTTAGAAALTNNYRLEVREGQGLNISGSSYNEGAGVQIGITFYGANGAPYAESMATLPATQKNWEAFDFDVMVPANAFYASLTFKHTGTGRLRLGNLLFRRRLNGHLIVDGTIETNALAANAVVADKIAANAITATHLSADSVTASAIRADSVGASEIAANAVYTNALQANAVVADKIAAGAVTSNKLNVVMGGGNLLTNSNFGDGTTGYRLNGAASIAIDTTLGFYGSANRCLKVTSTGGNNTGASRAISGLEPNTTYTFSAWVRISSAAGASPGPVGVTVQGGVTVVSTTTPTSVTERWTRLTCVFTTGATPGAVTLFVYRSGATTASSYFWTDAWQLEHGEVATAYAPRTDEILPGTINAAMIAANAITADKIKAGEITADKLKFTVATPESVTAAQEAAERAIYLQFPTERNDSAEGLNKWLYTRYTRPTATLSIAPTFTDLVGLQGQSSLVADASNIGPTNVADYYISHARTFVRATAAGTISFAASHDDGARIYVNGVSVYERNAMSSGVRFSLPLLAGWNAIDILVNDNGGSDGFWLVTPNIRTLVAEMRAPISPATVAGDLVPVKEAAEGAWSWRTPNTTTIDGSSITTNTVTANKIQLADLTEYAANPFMVPDGAGHNNITYLPNTADGVPPGAPSAYVGKMTSRDHRPLQTGMRHIPVQPGDMFFVEAWVARDPATGDAPASGTGNFNLYYSTVDKDKAYISHSTANSTAFPFSHTRSRTAADATTWTRVGGTVTVPPTVTGKAVEYLEFFPQIDQPGAGTVTWYITNYHVRRMNKGELIVDGAITATKIDTDAIEARHVKANAIESAAIKADAITAGKIGVDAVEARNIKANAVEAEAIKAGAITSAKIAAGAVTTNALTVYPHNLVDDPGWEDSGAGWSLQSWASFSTTEKRNGARSLRIPGDGTVHDMNTTGYIPVTPGDQYYVEGWIKAEAGTNAAAQAQIGFFAYKGDKTTAANGYINSGTTGAVALAGWTKVAGTYTIAADVNFIRPWVSVRNTATSGAFYFDDLVLRRLAADVEIRDGAISAPKIAAGAVSADKLTVGALSDNLVINPSFEDWSNTNTPAGWTIDTGASYEGAVYTRDTTGSRISGGSSLTSTAATGKSTRAYPATSIPATPGEKFHISVMAKSATNMSTAAASVGAYFYNQSGAYISSSDGPFKATTTAERYNHIATVPAGAAYLRPVLTGYSTSAGNKITWDSVETRRLIGGATIADAAILSAHLTDASVTTAKIGDAQIVTAKIADAQITNAKIKDLSAEKITAGTLDADRIAARSIGGEKLFIGDLTDYVDDGTFTGDLAVNWTVGGSPTFDTTQSATGTRSVKFTSNDSLLQKRTFPVKPGDKYLVELTYKTTADRAGIGGLRLRDPKTGDEAADWVGGYDLPTSTTWTTITRVATIKPGVTSVAPRLAFSLSAGTVWIDSYSMRRMDKGELIVDGSIEGTHITADAITTDHIQAGAVTAETIAADAIVGKHITLTDLADLFSGSDFEKPAANPWRFYGGNAFTLDSTTARTGTTSLKIDGTQSGSATLTYDLNVTPGDSYHVEFWAKKDAAWNGVGNNSKIRFGNASGGLLTAFSFAHTEVGTDWTQFSRVYTVPAGVTVIKVSISSDATKGTCWLDNISMRRRNGGELIVDGAISATKLATGAIVVGSDKTTFAAGYDPTTKASVTDLTNLANTVSAGESYTTNPYFTDWNTAYTPAGWVVTNGSAIRESTIVRSSTTALRQTVSAGTNAYLTANASTAAALPNADYLTVTADVYLTEGNFSGSGVLLRWRNTANAYADSYASFHAAVPNPNTGQWYRISMAVPRPTGFSGTFQRVELFLMSGFGSTNLSPITAKTIIWDCLLVRPSSQEEISAYIAGTWRTTGATTIDGGKITTDSITSTQIAAHSISAKQLFVGDSTNLVPIGSFGDAAMRANYPATGPFSYVSGADSRSGTGWALKITAPGAWNSLTIGQRIPVRPGDQLHVSWWARRAGATQSVTFNFVTHNAAGGTVSQDLRPSGALPNTAAPDGEWRQYGGTITVPAGVYFLTPQFKHITANTITGSWFVTDVAVLRMATGELIVDGAITTTKLEAGAVTANKLNVTAGGGNLLANSSFENTTNVHADWTANAFGSTVKVTRETARTFHGANAVKLVCSGAKQNAYLQQVVPVLPNTTYTFSAWLYVESITAGAYDDRAVLVQDDGGSYSETAGLNATHPKGTWVRKVVTHTTSASATNVNVRLMAPQGTVYWDAAQFEMGDLPSSYSPKTEELLPGTIVASHLDTDSVTAKQIKANAVESTHIKADAIEAGHIKAGSITGEKIKAGEITADKILLGDFTNHVENPSFETGDLTGWTSTGSWQVNNASPDAGTYKALVQFSGEVQSLLSKTVMDVKAGETVVCKASFYNDGFPDGGAATFGLWVNGTTAANMSLPTSNTGSTWVPYTYTYVVPEGVTKVQLRVAVAGGTAGRYVRVDSVSMRKALNGSMIVDGSISAGHIGVGEIKADHLSAGALVETSVVNGSFEAGLVGWELGEANGTISTVATAASGTTAMALNANANQWALQAQQTVDSAIAVSAGERLYLAAKVAGPVALNGGFHLRYHWLNAAKAQIGWADVVANGAVPAATGTWTEHSGVTAAAPAAARYLRISLYNTRSSAVIYVDDVIARRVVGGAQIAEATIVAANIADAAIEKAKIKDLAVSTAKIENLAVTDAKIKDLDAEKITAGYISSARIEAGSIAANKLNIAVGGGNLVANSNFEHSDVSKFANYGGGTRARTTGEKFNGEASLMVTNAASNQGIYAFSAEPVPAGTEVIASAYVKGQAGVTVTIAGRVNSATGAYLGEGQGLNSVVLNGSWQRITLASSYSTGVDFLAGVQIRQAGTSPFYVDCIQIERGNVATAWSPLTSELLPGTIRTVHIEAGAIKAEQIDAKAITADKLFVKVGGGNLLTNSGWEVIDKPSGSTTSSVALNGWGYNTGGGAAGSLAQSTEQCYRGTRALKVTNTSASGGYAGAARVNAYTVNQGSSYVFSAWVYRPTSNGFTNPVVAGVNGPGVGGVVTVGERSSAAGNVWERVQVNFTATANGLITVYVMTPAGVAAGANKVLYVDCVQLEEGDVATAYAPMVDEILPGTIVSSSLATGAVTADNIEAGAIKTHHVSTDYIYSGAIEAGQIEAGNITAKMTLTGGQIVAGNPKGNRIELGEAGFKQFGPDTAGEAGARVATEILADGTSRFSGSITAVDLTVEDGLELRGRGNTFAPGSLITLSTTTGGSSTPPGMTVDYEPSPVTIGNGHASVVGAHIATGDTGVHGAHAFFSDGGLSAGATYWPFPRVTGAGGETWASLVPATMTRVKTSATANAGARTVVIGEKRNAGFSGYPTMVLRQYDVAAMSATTAPVLKGSEVDLGGFNWFHAHRLGRCISPGSANTLQNQVAYARADYGAKQIVLRRYAIGDSTISAQSEKTIASPLVAPTSADANDGEKLLGVAYGSSAAMGFHGTDQTVWVIAGSINVYVYSDAATPVRLSDLEFPAAPGAGLFVTSGGVDDNTNSFAGFRSAPTNQATGWVKYTDLSWPGTDTRWVGGYAWRDASGAQESDLSAMGEVAMSKRARLVFTAPPLPDPAAGKHTPRLASDVNGIVVYLVRGPKPATGVGKSPAIYRHSVQPANGSTALAITTLPPTSGTVPKAATTFTGAGAAVIESNAKADGVPMIRLSGDGSAHFESLDVGGTGSHAFTGKAFEQLYYSIRAQTRLVGGGTIAVSTDWAVSWSAPFRTTGLGASANTATEGSFLIAQPPAGQVIYGEQGAPDVTVGAGGLVVPAGCALWYELPYARRDRAGNVIHDGSSPSKRDNFHLTGTAPSAGAGADPFVVPNDWVLLCVRNDESGRMEFTTGVNVDVGYDSDSPVLKQVILTSGNDASIGANNRPALRVGNIAGSHLRIDGDEIISMDNNTTQGILSLNLGGRTMVGGPTGMLSAPGTIKNGSTTCAVSAVNTAYNKTINFPIAFPASGSVPVVMVTADVANAHHVGVTVTSVNRNGFTLSWARTNGTGNFNVNWLAVAQH